MSESADVPKSCHDCEYFNNGVSFWHGNWRTPSCHHPHWGDKPRLVFLGPSLQGRSYECPIAAEVRRRLGAELRALEGESSDDTIVRFPGGTTARVRR